MAANWVCVEVHSVETTDSSDKARQFYWGIQYYPVCPTLSCRYVVFDCVKIKNKQVCVTWITGGIRVGVHRSLTVFMYRKVAIEFPGVKSSSAIYRILSTSARGDDEHGFVQTPLATSVGVDILLT